MNKLKQGKWKILLFSIGIILTVLARDYAVARRLDLGIQTNAWGGEMLIIPLIFLMYFEIKADWSFS